MPSTPHIERRSRVTSSQESASERPSFLSMPLGGFAVGVIMLASLAVAGCNKAEDIVGKTFPSYRYRLTVEFNTPEGVKRGSSVIQVTTSQVGKYNLDAEYVGHREVKGDAVVVDMGWRGRVFVILNDAAYVDNSRRSPHGTSVSILEQMDFTRGI